MNPVRAERSRYCIYAFVNKTSLDPGSRTLDPVDNTRDLHEVSVARVSSLRQVDEFSRSKVSSTLDLQRGETRGYWEKRQHGRWFEPTKGEVTADPPKVCLVTGSCGSEDVGSMDLLTGESRGYWKYHAPGK